MISNGYTGTLHRLPLAARSWSGWDRCVLGSEDLLTGRWHSAWWHWHQQMNVGVNGWMLTCGEQHFERSEDKTIHTRPFTVPTLFRLVETGSLLIELYSWVKLLFPHCIPVVKSLTNQMSQRTKQIVVLCAVMSACNQDVGAVQYGGVLHRPPPRSLFLSVTVLSQLQGQYWNCRAGLEGAPLNTSHSAAALNPALITHTLSHTHCYWPAHSNRMQLSWFVVKHNVPELTADKAGKQLHTCCVNQQYTYSQLPLRSLSPFIVNFCFCDTWHHTW